MDQVWPLCIATRLADVGLIEAENDVVGLAGLQRDDGVGLPPTQNVAFNRVSAEQRRPPCVPLRLMRSPRSVL